MYVQFKGDLSSKRPGGSLSSFSIFKNHLYLVIHLAHTRKPILCKLNPNKKYLVMQAVLNDIIKMLLWCWNLTFSGFGQLCAFRGAESGKMAKVNYINFLY